MSTYKQKVAARNMVENGGNASKAMVDAGYSATTAKTPSKLTQSQGFRGLLEFYGLSVQLIVESLVEDIKSKPGNRKAELELAAKLKGLFKAVEEEKIIVYEQPVSLLKFADSNDDLL